MDMSEFENSRAHDSPERIPAGIDSVIISSVMDEIDEVLSMPQLGKDFIETREEDGDNLTFRRIFEYSTSGEPKYRTLPDGSRQRYGDTSRLNIVTVSYDHNALREDIIHQIYSVIVDSHASQYATGVSSFIPSTQLKFVFDRTAPLLRQGGVLKEGAAVEMRDVVSERGSQEPIMEHIYAVFEYLRAVKDNFQ